MKTNNILKNQDYVSYLKYLILIPVILGLFAIILGIVLGFNKDYDLKSRQVFEVKFYTSVSNEEYNTYQNKIGKILKDNEYQSYRLERTGSYATCGINVIIPQVLSEDKITSLTSSIENITPANAETTIKVLNTSVLQPLNLTTNILYCLLAVGILLLVAFIYITFRCDIHAGYLTILSVLFNYGLLTILILLFRIPVNAYILVPFIISTIITLFIDMLLYKSMRNKIIADDNKMLTNKTVLYSTIQENIVPIVVLISLVEFISILSTIFGNNSLRFISIAIFFAVFTATYSAIFISTSIWSFVYNRKNDKRLIKKLEKMKNQELEKINHSDDQEKLIV